MPYYPIRAGVGSTATAPTAVQQAAAPPVQSPEGYYQSIVSQYGQGVPQQVLDYVHNAILGGSNWLADLPAAYAAIFGGPQAPAATGGVQRVTTTGPPPAAPTPPAMSFADFMNWANSVGQASMAGATSVQPNVPGGAQYLNAGGPYVPGTPGQVGWDNPNDPVLHPPPPPPPTQPPPPPPDPFRPITHDPTIPAPIGGGPVGPEAEPPPGWIDPVTGIHEPDPAVGNYPVAPGFPGSGVIPRDLGGGVVLDAYNLPGETPMHFNAPKLGAGAMLAESLLGGPAANLDHSAVSPIYHYRGRRPSLIM